MSAAWISPTAHPSEEYECLDCQLVGVLNVHGQCQRCGSSAVLPLPIVEQTGTWVNVGDAPYWVPRDPQFANNPKRAIVAFEPHRVSEKPLRKKLARARQPARKIA